jgi:hypothetical protein
MQGAARAGNQGMGRVLEQPPCHHQRVHGGPVVHADVPQDPQTPRIHLHLHTRSWRRCGLQRNSALHDVTNPQ